MTDTQTPAPSVDAESGSPKTKTRNAKPKHTFMLHNPDSFASMGK
jgi:hypothetical protein